MNGTPPACPACGSVNIALTWHREKPEIEGVYLRPTAQPTYGKYVCKDCQNTEWVTPESSKRWGLA